MSFNVETNSLEANLTSNKSAISAKYLSKNYTIFARPIDRLKQFLWGRHKKYYKEFPALCNISFDLNKGDILGVIGRNGSGKSTLLQLICGTLQSSAGQLKVNGRIAALLELGTGFNPEFTGRENVYLNASILGLEEHEIKQKYQSIVDFSGIEEFIDQPVKTYSSGMQVRLAFAVAISVEPDILIIDEALSVGDGAFAKKSFDQVMKLKEAGTTILFCSHSMYQVEALCNRVIWLEKGEVQKQGLSADVVVEYNHFLEALSEPSNNLRNGQAALSVKDDENNQEQEEVSNRTAKITSVKVISNNNISKHHVLTSQQSDLQIDVQFSSDKTLPVPSVALSIVADDGRIVASSGTQNDNFKIIRDTKGSGEVSILFKKIPLLKGLYYIDIFLACENAIHIYEYASRIANLEVVQEGLEQGIFAIPHQWSNG